MRTIYVFRCPDCKALHRRTGPGLCQCGILLYKPGCFTCKGKPTHVVLWGERQAKYFCDAHLPLMAIGWPVECQPPKFKSTTSSKPIILGAKRRICHDNKTRS